MTIRNYLLVLTALGIEAALLGLAHWQYGRMLEKQNLAVAEAVRPSLTLAGVWDTAATTALDNQPNPTDEGQVGWRIFTPLVTSTSVVIVDRGWAPFPPDRTAPPNFASVMPTTNHVNGVWAAFPTRQGWLQGPDTTTHPRILAWLNPTRITSATVAPMYVQATTPTAQGLAAQHLPLTGKANRHASYALQWLVMALIFPVLALWRWRKP